MNYYTAKELSGLTGLPTTESGIIRKAKKQNWQSKQRAGRGGGKEYSFDSLSEETQAALLIREQRAIDPEPKPAAAEFTYDRENLWAVYANKSENAKVKAEGHLKILLEVEALVEAGVGRTEALKQITKSHELKLATVRSWYYGTPNKTGARRFDRCDWLAALAPGYIGRMTEAECDQSAWEFFKADYLRLEQPTAQACFDRLEEVAKTNNWPIPSYAKYFVRRIEREIPTQTLVLMREGEHALARMYPALQRDVSNLHALEWINGDGYMHNVFVETEDGRVIRLKTWFWQDIYSRKILSYRTAETENTDTIRLSFGVIVEVFGIPMHVTIDNTRAAANKWMTGGVANRYRFKVKEDDPLGLFPSLDIKVHWTSVLNGKGWGQAKPIERAFGVGGLGEFVDKHPEFAGAYTGENPTAKPENYASNAVPIATFHKVLEASIRRWNEKTGRRTQMCAGKLSYEQAFQESYQRSSIRRATEEQRRLWLLSAEGVKVQKDATVTLDAGSATKIGRNRYHAEALYQHIGQKVIIRFDPDQLHSDVHVYTLDNRYICHASVIDAAGFGDTQAGREHQRHRKAMMKATKQAAASEQQMRDVEMKRLMREADEAVLDEPEEMELPKVVNLDFAHPIQPKDEEPDNSEKYEQNFQNRVTQLFDRWNDD